MRICSFSALVRGLQNLEAPFGKVLILFQRSRHCGELNRGLKNLEKLSKGKVSKAAERQKNLILLVRSCCLGGLNRGSQNLETFPKGYGFILFACTKRTGSTPEVCEPLDSGEDSNLRSIHGFRESDRPSSCNRPRRALQGFRVSTVRI